MEAIIKSPEEMNKKDWMERGPNLCNVFPQGNQMLVSNNKKLQEKEKKMHFKKMMTTSRKRNDVMKEKWTL